METRSVANKEAIGIKRKKIGRPLGRKSPKPKPIRRKFHSRATQTSVLSHQTRRVYPGKNLNSHQIKNSPVGIQNFKTRNQTSSSLQDITHIYHPSVRMIDLNLMAHSLWCVECNQPLSLRNCVRDDSNVYRTRLQVRCLNCSKIIPVLLSLLDENGDCAAYCSGLILENSNLNYKKLAESCMEVGKQLDMLNSQIPRSCNRESLKPLQVPIPDEKIMDTFHLNRNGNDPLQIAHPYTSFTITTDQNPSSQENHSFDLNMILEQDQKMESDGSLDPFENDFEESFDDECEDVVSDHEEEYSTPPVDISDKKAPEPAILESCLYCELKFSKFFEARMHMDEKHKDYKRFKCGVCQKQYTAKEPFQSHIYAHHRESKKRLCPHCGKLCENSSALISHLNVHKTEANIQCPKCPKMLKSTTLLYSHMFGHERVYTCDFCQKKIRRRVGLIEHMRMHINSKSFDCEICGAKFYRNDNRNTHMKHNHNWICLVCSNKFFMMEEVKMHTEKEHTKEEIVEAVGEGIVPYEKVTPFQCQTCFRYLASKQSLEFHTTTHTGEGKRRGQKKQSK